MTAIGEKGINLSGGQKARVALARAVYSQVQVILLDDPISSLDIFSAQQILNECLLGELKTKTRILATHHLDILPFVDYIYVMDKGSIVEHGTFSQLNNDENSFYQKHLATSEEMTRFSKEEKESKETANLAQIDQDKLETEEDRCYGRVKFSVYKNYLSFAGGKFILILVIYLFIL